VAAGLDQQAQKHFTAEDAKKIRRGAEKIRERLPSNGAIQIVEQSLRRKNPKPTI